MKKVYDSQLAFMHVIRLADTKIFLSRFDSHPESETFEIDSPECRSQIWNL
jgi:hypothetical protein